MIPSIKYAQIEEERRFLLDSIPKDLEAEGPFMRIVDRYLSGTRLRLRRMESPQGEILVRKFGQKYRTPELEAHQTIMTNIYLNEGEYQVLASLGGATITKRRYSYHYAEDDYSVDVFEGPLSALVLAEIEGHSGKDITSLPLPAFAVREVTDDLRFTGRELAALSREDFQRWKDSW